MSEAITERTASGIALDPSWGDTNLLLARDGPDNHSYSSARNVEPREEFPSYAHQESFREVHTDMRTTSVPPIIVYQASDKESISDAVLASTIPMDLNASISSDDEGSLHENSDLLVNIEDVPTPPAISYSLRLAFQNVSLPVDDIIRTISANTQSFRKIEQVAEEKVKSSCAKSLGVRELIFRDGNCTVVNEAGNGSTHSLTSLEDWRALCIILLNYWISGTYQRLSLRISRNYYALATVAADGESFAKTKNSEIDTLMKETNGRYYIPRTDLMRVTSEETIRQIIMGDTSINYMGLEEKEAFVQDVQKSARKLLALCVYARVDMQCLKKLLDRSLSDVSLPLDMPDCCHSVCRSTFKDLLAKQGSFMAPDFNTLGEHKRLEPCVVLPMHFVPKVGEDSTAGTLESSAKGLSPPLKDAEQVVLDPKILASCGAGAHSRVYRVRIDADHHRLSPDRNSLFALKEFKDRPQNADLTFEQERKILDELRKLPNKHIVVHCATWTQDQKYYMLFPYAVCNLREYMTRQQFGAFTKENILWLLSQLRGLAHALRNIHNITEAQTPPPSPKVASTSQKLRKSAWHHDVKPENILFYRVTGSKRGVFKLADFGSGKVHTLRSGSANTRSANGTLTYEPPEAFYEGATSRPYDIWSLGCVVLELLLWAVLGYDSVHKFAEARAGRNSPGSPPNVLKDDAFWDIKADGPTSKYVPILRQVVVNQLQQLKEKVLKQESQPFKEVVELIPRMLDPYRETRITALDLWDTLDRIYQQTKVDLSDIDDNSLPKPADPDRSALPRLSLQAPDRPNLATMAPLLGDALPVPSYPIGNSRLTISPVDTLSPRMAHHRSHSSLGSSSDLVHSPQSASGLSKVNNAGSRRNSNVSNSNARMAERP